jgi:hypothetical protein
VTTHFYYVVYGSCLGIGGDVPGGVVLCAFLSNWYWYYPMGCARYVSTVCTYRYYHGHDYGTLTNSDCVNLTTIPLHVTSLPLPSCPFLRPPSAKPPIIIVVRFSSAHPLPLSFLSTSSIYAFSLDTQIVSPWVGLVGRLAILSHPVRDPHYSLRVVSPGLPSLSGWAKFHGYIYLCFY